MAAPLVSSGYESPWTREVLDAARAGDVERFKHLRRQRGRSSSFAVAQAPARCSAAAAFSPLCHRGADVVPGPGLDGARTCGGNTALHIAAGLGHADLALFLCQAEWPLLTERNRAGETPLHCAAKAGNARIAGYLLHYLPADAAVVVRAVNRSGETALHEAARGGHEDVVKLLLDKDEDLAGVVSNEGVSALYLAAMSGHEAVVRRLLHRSPEGTKVTPSAVSSAGVDGQTALHAAVLLRNKDIARLLVDWDSSLTTRVDSRWSTPLHFAASIGEASMVVVLLTCSVSSVYRPDNSGEYPIHVAARMGNDHVVRLLLEKCPDSYELLGKGGRSFLHVAAAWGRLPVVELASHGSRLLPASALNARDSEGNTVLHLAVRGKHHKCVQVLAANTEVDMSLVNGDRLTPLDLVVKGMDHGFVYTLNAQMDILRQLAWTAARLGPRRLDHLIDDFDIGENADAEQRKLENIPKNLTMVSALIATASFSAFFGLVGRAADAGATTSRAGQYLFKALLLSDSLAFLCSIVATVWLTYAASDSVDPRVRSRNLRQAIVLMKHAARSMLVAFSLGLYFLLLPVDKRMAPPVMALTLLLVLAGNLADWEPLSLLRAVPAMLRRGVLVVGVGVFEEPLSPHVAKHVARPVRSSLAGVLLWRMAVTLFVGLLVFGFAFI